MYMIASVDAREKVGMNQEIEVVFDMARVHFFDKETENTII